MLGRVRGSDDTPTRRAFIVAASVAAIALIVYAVVGFLAPRMASKPPAHLSAEDLTRGLVVGAPGTFTPSPTATRNLESPTPYLIAPSPPSVIVASAKAAPPTDVPALLNVQMTVDKQTVKPGDALTYEVIVSNIGGTTFKGALTVNLHTPSGTLRCGMQVAVNICTTPGDYDGSTQDPNAPHNNPPGTTELVSIAPGAQLVVETLEVQVAANTSGNTLYNHAHVDGLKSVTRDAPDVVTTSALPVSIARAPNVTVR